MKIRTFMAGAFITAVVFLYLTTYFADTDPQHWRDECEIQGGTYSLAGGGYQCSL